MYDTLDHLLAEVWTLRRMWQAAHRYNYEPKYVYLGRGEVAAIMRDFRYAIDEGALWHNSSGSGKLYGLEIVSVNRDWFCSIGD